MITDKQLENPDELSSIFETWITNDESEYAKVEDKYIKAREYFEHSQSPANKPKNKQYVEENLLTDMIYRLVGQMIGGKFTPYLKGVGPKADAVKELFMDILERNKFQKHLIEKACNFFYVEGLVGWKVDYNPFKRGKYGLGFPEIHILRPGEILLDANSNDPYHDDDLKRIHRKKMLLSEAQEKYPEHADKIVSEYTENEDDNSTEEFCSLYEIQFKKVSYDNIEDDDEDPVYEEIEEYYVAKVINKTVVVEQPRKSRFKRFTIIPVIHTPRTKTFKYPFGMVERLQDTQDQLNVTSSVILEAVKTSIKMQAIVTGAKGTDEAKLRRDLTKTGIGFVDSAQAKVNPLAIQPLVRPVVEWHEMTRRRFDEISGDWQGGEAVRGEMSGKAISLLQFRGSVPEYVNKSHIENSLVEMGWVILECIFEKMKEPFSIDRKINGQDKKIYYNTPVKPEMNLEQGDGYNVVDRAGLVNNMESEAENMPVMELDVDVEMNVLQNQELEMNKAILMRGQRAISLEDFIKIMYPESWKDKLDKILAEDKAMKLVQKIQEVSPELVDVAMNQIDQFIQLGDNAGGY